MSSQGRLLRQKSRDGRRHRLDRTGDSEYTTLSARCRQAGANPPHPVCRSCSLVIHRRLHAWNPRRGVDAATTGSHAYLWWHLYDFANHQGPQIGTFLEYLGSRRDDGDLTVSTMRDLQPTRLRADDARVLLDPNAAAVVDYE